MNGKSRSTPKSGLNRLSCDRLSLTSQRTGLNPTSCDRQNPKSGFHPTSG